MRSFLVVIKMFVLRIIVLKKKYKIDAILYN